ncbi:MAG: hypothetical protein ACOYOF_02085 [Verrucomicrobiaceae bacterium]
MKRIALFILLSASFVPAQEQPDPVLARMRDGLRKLTQRVTEAEATAQAAQAAQTAAETANKEVTAKLDSALKELKDLKVQSAADADRAKKAQQDLESKVAVRDQEIARLTESLSKWKTGYEKAVDFAKSTESKRASFESQNILLQRKVEDRETKNRELFKVGSEILERYKNFGLGSALTAREPFTGIARVKLQTLVQDYADKLEDQTVKPEKTAKP